jgi:hypothetical protein
MSGCLTNFLFFILIAILIFFVYKWVISLGSANIVITKLTVTEKIPKSGEPIEGSKVVNLHLTNIGDQPGKFTLDMNSYIEFQELEGREIKSRPNLWSFSTELYFDDLDEWIEYQNSKIWKGGKITASVLEINIAKQETLELEAYLKGPQSWLIDIPGISQTPEEEDIPGLSALRITIFSPSGEVSLSMEAEL